MDVDLPAETRLADLPPDHPEEDTPPKSAASGGIAVRVPDRFRPEPIPPTLRWYGWQTLLADAAGVALLSAGVGMARIPGVRDYDLYCYVPGAVMLGLGTPVLHARNGAIDRAAASGLARMVGIPAVVLSTVLFQVSQAPSAATPFDGTAPARRGPSSDIVAPLVVGGIAVAGISALDAIFAWSAPPPPRVGAR